MLRGPARELKKRTDHRVERGEVQIPLKERTVLSSRGELLESKVEKEFCYGCNKKKRKEVRKNA